MHTPNRGRITAALTTIAMIALTTLATAIPGEAAARKDCRVKNATQGTWFATDSGQALTNAIAAADAGDRLNVFGTCRGSFASDVDLTVVGSKWADSPTTLRGTGTGRIWGTYPDTTIRLDRLTFAGSTAGGIDVTEGATVALSRSNVLDNSTPSSSAGAGIQNGGDLTISSSRILRNRTGNDGGGIFNYGDLVVNDSVINRNHAGGVGGGLFNEGEAALNRSRVRFNTGGGILNVSGLELNNTVVSNNTPCNVC